MHVTARPKPRQTMSGPTMRALCPWNVMTVVQMWVHVVIVLNQWLNHQQTTPETLANRRLQEDYTHPAMLKDCVSARWSLMCQCLALTSLRDSYPLSTRHSRESVML